MHMKILKADVSDAGEILGLQKLAYLIEAERYDDYDIHPLKQTLEEIREQFKDHTFLKAVQGDRIIGSVRAGEKDGTCYIGRLAVHPEMQNKGIGTALMQEIEKCCVQARFELFVGSKSENNIHLYRKLGYNIYKTARYGCGNIEIFYMEKNVEKR